MFRALIAGLVALPLLAGQASALPPQTLTYLGMDETSIRKALESFGYEVLTFGEDESGFEAEILDGASIYDLSISPTDGMITNVEFDTDVDGDA
ncbi:hypothetical protein HKCCSP123_01190 [Rhodobacterales bacterium HKCCSP123]|nr:hypothetical protein [Rhodobacterales bacterium HKCCSP123]